MGDAADAILNGECCQFCGEWGDELMENGKGIGFQYTFEYCKDDDDEYCLSNLFSSIYEDENIIIKDIKVEKNKLQIIYASNENPEKNLLMFP